MNPYLYVILGTLLAGYILNTVSRILNISSLSPELPAEFAGVFDPEAYADSQRYARAQARLEQISESVQLAALVAAVLLGAFAWWNSLVISTGLSPVAAGLLFFAGVAAAAELLSLPFSAWRTFVLEERFGFNRTTVSLFVRDHIKGWLLTALIGGPLLALVLAFFEYVQGPAWLYGWALVVVVMLGVQYVAPVWILPLFNDFTPLESGELREKIENLAREQGFRLSGIFVMDGSKRSSRSNAFFTGLGRTKRIALFDTLTGELGDDETVAVLAHELGHSRLGHVRKNLVLAAARTGLLFGLLSFFIASPGLHAAFGVAEPSIYTGLLFFLLLYSPLSLVLSIGASAVSRRFEYQADAFAAKARDPEDLASALKKLAASNLSNLTPHPFYVVLHYSHPPVLSRIRRLQGGDGA